MWFSLHDVMKNLFISGNVNYTNGLYVVLRSQADLVMQQLHLSRKKVMPLKVSIA